MLDDGMDFERTFDGRSENICYCWAASCFTAPLVRLYLKLNTSHAIDPILKSIFYIVKIRRYIFFNDPVTPLIQFNAETCAPDFGLHYFAALFPISLWTLKQRGQ